MAYGWVMDLRSRLWAGHGPDRQVMDRLLADYGQVIGSLWVGHRQVMDLTGRLWVGYGQLIGGLWATYGWVMGRLLVGHGQVTGGSWAGCRQFTGRLWMAYGQVIGGSWTLWEGHIQWVIIGNLKFKAYFKILYSFCVVDFYSAF